MTEPPDDYWPEPLKHIPHENPMRDDLVIVGEMRADRNPDLMDRLTYTGLVEENYLDKLLNVKDNIDRYCGIRATGPRPCPMPGTGYIPKFYIEGGGIVPEGIEPLVIGWHQGKGGILLPDNGFLMTYGLVPRLVALEDVIYWDDISYPRFDVVKCIMVCEGRDSVRNCAQILIRREYLEDYATLRERHMIQVYFENNSSQMTEYDAAILGDQGKRC